MNRGEVWWAETEELARRPHLVLSRQGAIPVLRTVLAVPATRTIRDIPTQVRLDEEDGMPGPCALSLDNLTPMPKAFLTQRITRLSTARLVEVCRALAAATGCG